jgi:hypothetical protein
VVKVDGGHQPVKHRVLKHHTTHHVKQQSPGNSCGFFVCINMLCFGSQPFTNISVSPFICTLLSSFIFTCAFHLLLIHFLIISWQDYDVEFINKKGSSLEHIREDSRVPRNASHRSKGRISFWMNTKMKDFVLDSRLQNDTMYNTFD